MKRTRGGGVSIVVLGLFALLHAGCSFDGGGVSAVGTGDDPGSDAAPDAGPGDPEPPDAGEDEEEEEETQEPDAGSVEPAPGELPSPSTTTAPTLDGDDAEWDQDTFRVFEISEAAQYFGVHQAYGYDAEVRFASMHDDNYVYFFFAVTDDQIVEDSDVSYQDDAVELYLDAQADMSGPYGEDDHWIVIESTGSYESLGPAAISIDGDVVTTETGYNVEIRVAKNAMNGSLTGGVAGFDLGLVDDDGHGNPSADAYGLWFVDQGDHCDDCCMDDPDSRAWCDTTLFGRLLLLP